MNDVAAADALLVLLVLVVWAGSLGTGIYSLWLCASRIALRCRLAHPPVGVPDKSKLRSSLSGRSGKHQRPIQVGFAYTKFRIVGIHDDSAMTWAAYPGRHYGLNRSLTPRHCFAQTTPLVAGPVDPLAEGAAIRAGMAYFSH